MRRAFFVAALAGIFAVALPAAMQAQALYAGFGVVNGVSDFGDATDAGWLANAGLLFNLGDGSVSVGVDGMYGSVGGASDGPNTSIYGAMGLVDVSFGEGGQVQPYAFAGAGLLAFDVDLDTPGVDGSESNFGYQFGAGLSFPASDAVSIWVDGRYIGSEDVKAIAGVAGLAFSLGG